MVDRAIVIYGPHGSGKTVNAARFARRYKAERIVDGWDGVEPLRAGDLALTNRPGGCFDGTVRLICVIPIEEALRDADGDGQAQGHR